MLRCSVENRVIGGVTEATDGRSEEALIEVLLIGVSFVLFLGGLNCRKGLVLETQLAGQMTVVALRANGLGVDCCALLVSLSSTAAATSSNSTMSSSTALELSRKKGVHDVVLARNSLLHRLEVVQIFKTSLSREILDMDRIVARMLVQVTGTTSITMVTSTISGMTTANRRVKPECRLTKRESIAAGLRHRS